MRPNSKFRLTIGGLLLIASGLPITTAYAGYVVIEDDLMPTAPVAQPATHYSIPFAKDSSPLGPIGRATVNALIPQMSGQTIRIVGRPDATPYMSGKLSQLASNRANTLREYLMRAGIPASAITLEVNNTPNPQPDGSIYPSDIFIGAKPTTYLSQTSYSTGQANASTSMAYQTPTPVQSVQSVQYGLPAPTQPLQQPMQAASAFTAAEKSARMQLIQFISRSAQTGQMDSLAAIKMIQILSDADKGGSPQQTQIAAPQKVAVQLAAQTIAAAPLSTLAPAPTPAPAPLFVAASTSSVTRKQTWQLEPTKTLRDNLDAWALRSGWNPTQWKASNYFQVTTAATLEGDFPDILRQIAEGTKLNICIYPRDKKINVTDTNISCKD